MFWALLLPHLRLHGPKIDINDKCEQSISDTGNGAFFGASLRPCLEGGQAWWFNLNTHEAQNSFLVLDYFTIESDEQKQMPVLLCDAPPLADACYSVSLFRKPMQECASDDAMVMKAVLLDQESLATKVEILDVDETNGDFILTGKHQNAHTLVALVVQTTCCKEKLSGLTIAQRQSLC